MKLVENFYNLKVEYNKYTVSLLLNSVNRKRRANKSVAF